MDATLKIKLSDRLRPDCEAAPWVIESVKKMEHELAAAYAEMNKHRRTIGAVFDRNVWARAESALSNVQAQR